MWNGRESTKGREIKMAEKKRMERDKKKIQILAHAHAPY